ncbi:MAG: hypothetical protein ACI4TS_06945 [Bacteroidaceae bacterium]
MKKLFTIVFVFAFAISLNAQKIENVFWGSTLGMSSGQVLENLEKQKLEPIVDESGIYLQNVELEEITFSTIGMKFTANDEFYNVFGYNKFKSRKEAQTSFDDSLSKLRLKYPNIQSMSKSDNCFRLYAYTDDGHENVLSLGLYKGNEGAYFVRLNVYSDYLVRRNKEE